MTRIHKMILKKKRYSVGEVIHIIQDLKLIGNISDVEYIDINSVVKPDDNVYFYVKRRI